MGGPGNINVQKKWDIQSNSMSFSPVPTARQGIPTPFSGELHLKPAGIKLPPFAQNTFETMSLGMDEKTAKQDFAKVMMQ
jgi:hypothetical protein